MIRWLLIIGGIYNLIMAVFHMFFWKLFKWPAELACLSIDNRAIIQTFNLVVILFLFIFAAVSFLCQDQLRRTLLGVFVLLSIAGLWIIRGIAEIIYWDFSILIVMICLTMSVIYLLPLLPSLRKA